MRPIEERFWEKVGPREPGKCWLWMGRANNGIGYGQLYRSGNKRVYVHRLAYELLVGPIPQGMVLDHVCHNPACVNPEHLRACTRCENQQNLKLARDNTSGFKGVSWHKARKAWRATICANHQQKHLGLFPTPELAHAAYCEAAKRLHGEFANDGRAA